MGKIEFTKIVASGNDFVVVDNSRSSIKNNLKLFAKNTCDRKFGIGADGLLLVEKSKKADFKMRIFNPDGSEAEMCGNGARAISLFAFENKIAKTTMSFETKAGIIEAKVLNKNCVKIKTKPPKNIKLDILVKINKKPICINFIDTGVPHAVIFVSGLEKIDVFGIGRLIRNHPKFMPRGTNVDFIEVFNKNSLKIRTYERGVEDETLACGTGSVAGAIIFVIKSGALDLSKINVITRSRETLKVSFDRCGNEFSNVWLEGKVKKVFQGNFK